MTTNSVPTLDTSQGKDASILRSEMTPTEEADRLATRELVDAYAHCADRRDAEGQKAQFSEDTPIRRHIRKD